MAYFIGEMTADEVREIFPQLDYVVLPVGSTEQHSFHLPFLSDSIQAEGIARAAATEGLKRGLKLGVLPTVTYGYSEEFWNYTGSIVLRPETLEAVVLDIAESLKHHGAKRMLIIDGHYSNMPILDMAVDKIQRHLGLPCHLVMWTNFMKPEDSDEREEEKGHAAYIESCVDLYFRPEWVKMEKAKVPKVTWNRDSTVGWWGGKYFEELTDTGALGSGVRATPEMGRKVVERVVDRLVDALKRDAGLS